MTAQPIPSFAQDPAMPWAAELLQPQKVQAKLEALLGPLEVSAVRVVRHKPGRRALLEFDLETPQPHTLIGKVRAKGPDKTTFRLQQALWQHGFGSGDFQVPEPVGLIPDWHLSLQRKVPGTTAFQLSPQQSHRIAELAHHLHSAPIAPNKQHTLATELSVLQQQLLALQKPAWHARLERVLEATHTLAHTLPLSPPRPIHRDFYPDQVLVDGPRLYLLDLDLCSLGDPALDIGNYLAHLSEYALRHLGNPAALEAQEAALSERFMSLEPTATWHAIQAYKTLALVRHIAISQRIAARHGFGLAMLELCEERLA